MDDRLWDQLLTNNIDYNCEGIFYASRFDPNELTSYKKNIIHALGLKNIEIEFDEGIFKFKGITEENQESAQLLLDELYVLNHAELIQSQGNDSIESISNTYKRIINESIREEDYDSLSLMISTFIPETVECLKKIHKRNLIIKEDELKTLDNLANFAKYINIRMNSIPYLNYSIEYH